MKFERIGAQGVKIILDSEETALLYRRLSEKGSAEGRMLIAALLAAAQNECAVSFSGSELNVEILDSQSGAVIYISEIRPYYYLSKRRDLSMVRKTNKQLLCFFDSAEKLLRFIRCAACTFFYSASAKLYSSGLGFILEFDSLVGGRTEALLDEFGVSYGYSARSVSEEYEMILAESAVKTLTELLNKRSLLPYPQMQTDNCRKQ